VTIAKLAFKLLTSSSVYILDKTLAESVASITLICALDREGTIATPHPIVEELAIVQQDGTIYTLDVTEDLNMKHGIRFEDDDWEMHIK